MKHDEKSHLKNSTSENNQFFVNRRAFIGKSVIASIGLMLPNYHLTAFAKIPKNSITMVDPATAMTAITAAKTTLDILASFSGSNDSGIAAMMRYQNALLHVIIDQLGEIQKSLLTVQNAIAVLPEQIKKALAEQFRIELIANINGAASRYVTNVLSPCMTDPELINNPQVQSEISNIVFIVDQNISTLNALQTGIGPEACMIAPLAMSLNIAGRTNLGHAKSIKISQLLRYKQWFDDMLSDKQGSIKSVQTQAIIDHDRYISQLENNPLANRLGIKNFTISGSQIGIEETDPAVMISTFGLASCDYIEGKPCDKFGGYRPKDGMLATALTALYIRIVNITPVVDNKLDAYLLKYNLADPIIYTKHEPATMTSYKPYSGKYHYLHVVPPKTMLTTTYVKELVESNKTAAASNNAFREEIKLALAQANLERAKIAFCAQARIVALNSKKRIEEYINIIE
jgi:hypothetical protein